MEIKKYKNMALRLLEILKANGIKQPVGFKIDQAAGTGFKEDVAEKAFDINEMSQRGGSEMADNEGGEGGNDASNEELLMQNDRL